MSDALTKADMSAMLFDELGLNKRESKELIECLFEEVKTALEAGESVKISGFGNFNLLRKKERPGRNPKTGEAVAVSARTVVTFKSGQKFRAALENAKV